MTRYLAITALVTLLSSNWAMAQQEGQYRSPLHESFARAIELCNSLGWSSSRQCQQNRASVEQMCAVGSPGWCDLAERIRDDAERSPFPHQRITPEPNLTGAPVTPGVGVPAGQRPLAVQDVDPLIGTGSGVGPVPDQAMPSAPSLNAGPTSTGIGASGAIPPSATVGQDDRTFQDVLQGLSSEEN